MMTFVFGMAVGLVAGIIGGVVGLLKWLGEPQW